MTDTSTRSERLREPWLIRRIIYILAGLVGVIAAVFFGATADHLDTIDRTMATLTPIILALVSTLAAPKANPGADAGTAAPVRVDLESDRGFDVGAVADIVEQVLGRVIPAGQHRADHTTGLDDLRTSLAVEG